MLVAVVAGRPPREEVEEDAELAAVEVVQLVKQVPEGPTLSKVRL